MKPLTGECNCENGKNEKDDAKKEDKNKVGIGCSPWQRGCVLDHLHGGKIMCPFSDFLAVATALLSHLGAATVAASTEDVGINGDSHLPGT